MAKSAHTQTTGPDIFLRAWNEAYAALGNRSSDAAEVKIENVIKSAVDRSEQIWAKPAQSWDDVVERAKVAFYWNADGIDESGAPTLESLHSDHHDKRSVAELIAAVLALDS